MTIFDFITLFREVSIGHFQRVRLVNRARLLHRTAGPVPFVLMLRTVFPELAMSTDLLGFEHPSALGTSILLVDDKKRNPIDIQS